FIARISDVQDQAHFILLDLLAKRSNRVRTIAGQARLHNAHTQRMAMLHEIERLSALARYPSVYRKSGGCATEIPHRLPPRVTAHENRCADRTQHLTPCDHFFSLTSLNANRVSPAAATTYCVPFSE